MVFAHLKRILKLGRLRLRGRRGAQDEFTLAAIAQNLRRLATIIAKPHLRQKYVQRDVADIAPGLRSVQMPQGADGRAATQKIQVIPHADS